MGICNKESVDAGSELRNPFLAHKICAEAGMVPSTWLSGQGTRLRIFDYAFNLATTNSCQLSTSFCQHSQRRAECSHTGFPGLNTVCHSHQPMESYSNPLVCNVTRQVCPNWRTDASALFPCKETSTGGVSWAIKWPITSPVTSPVTSYARRGMHVTLIDAAGLGTQTSATRFNQTCTNNMSEARQHHSPHANFR